MGSNRLKTAVALIWAACLCVWGVSGCSEPTAAPLRIGTNPWVGYGPLFLAEDLHEFEDLPVYLVEHSSNSQSLRAFRNGTIEAAALTLDEALQLTQTVPEARVVLALDVSHGADALVARPEITALDQLEGRRVGVENTATGAYLLSRALDHTHLSLSDIQIVSLPLDKHLQAYRGNRVDALVTFDPVRTQLLNQDQARHLFDSGMIPGEIVDVLVVHHNYLERYPRVVSSVVEAWFHALDHYRDKPDTSIRMMAARAGLSKPQLRAAMDNLRLQNRAENRTLLAGARPALDGTARRMTRIMTELRLLPSGARSVVIESGPLLRAVQ